MPLQILSLLIRAMKSVIFPSAYLFDTISDNYTTIQIMKFLI